MNRFKRPIAIFLLLVFGFLSIKNLIPSMAASSAVNCEEFGHIHWYKLAKTSVSDNLSPGATTAQGKDEACHSSKSIFNSAPLPVAAFEVQIPIYNSYFALVPFLENRFKSPDLDPLRKPPRV